MADNSTEQLRRLGIHGWRRRQHARGKALRWISSVGLCKGAPLPSGSCNQRERAGLSHSVNRRGRTGLGPQRARGGSGGWAGQHSERWCACGMPHRASPVVGLRAMNHTQHSTAKSDLNSALSPTRGWDCRSGCEPIGVTGRLSGSRSDDDCITVNWLLVFLHARRSGDGCTCSLLHGRLLRGRSSGAGIEVGAGQQAFAGGVGRALERFDLVRLGCDDGIFVLLRACWSCDCATHRTYITFLNVITVHRCGVLYCRRICRK